MEFWIKYPTFQYYLKPWEQFLNDGAPGSGINPKAKFLGKVTESDDFETSTINENSNFQIIPPGGMAIWADWCREHQEIECRINEVCSTLSK